MPAFATPLMAGTAQFLPCNFKPMLSCVVRTYRLRLLFVRHACRDEAGADLATLMAGLKLSRELAATPAMAKLVSEEAFPGAPKIRLLLLEQFVALR